MQVLMMSSTLLRYLESQAVLSCSCLGGGKLVAPSSHFCSVISALEVLEVFSGFGREYFGLLPELSG